jgi:hypothetical protein
MPRLPVNYSKTIIYVIKCKDDNITEEYVGSTINFIERKSHHKKRCNNEKYNLKVYKYIRENGGWENWIMLEIEKYPCNDKNEAHKREEEIRVERNAKLNSIKAFYDGTNQEYMNQYRKEHKESIKELKQKHYKENIKELKEQMKKYRQFKTNIIYNCSCGWIGNQTTKWFHINKSKQHQEYINNK